jgi:hypothetical protein
LESYFNFIILIGLFLIKLQMPYGIFFQKFTVGQPGMTGFGASIQPSGTAFGNQPSGTAFGNQPSGTTFGNQPSITTGFSAMKPTLGMISD